MIQLFRKNDLINVAALIPYVILLRSYSFAYPEAHTLQSWDGLINQWIFNEFIPDPLVQSIVAAFLVYGQALMLVFLINRHKLNHVPASLSGLFYVMATSCLPEFQQLSPELIGLTFLILTGFSTFKVYKRASAVLYAFNCALLIALASFFYFPYIIASIALFIEIMILRRFVLKERIAFLIGLITLYWIVFSLVYYLEIERFLSYYPFSIKEAVLGIFNQPVDSVVVWIGYFAIVAFLGLNYFAYVKKKSIEGRKKISYFYWLIAAAVLSTFIFSNIEFHHILFGSITIATFVSMTFLSIRNGSLAELLHIVLLIGLFSLHYGDVFFTS